MKLLLHSTTSPGERFYCYYELDDAIMPGVPSSSL